MAESQGGANETDGPPPVAEISVTVQQEPASSGPDLDPSSPGTQGRSERDADAQGGFSSIGRELDETAPVWRVYRDEVRYHDQTVTLDEWNKTLDVLLIFAGLFSAVVTAFVVGTIPLLNPQEDNIYKAMYALARSLSNDTVLPPPLPAREAETSSLWINGLWFASLFVSLAVAFFAILAKQWLVEYNHRMADPPASVTHASTLRQSGAILDLGPVPPARQETVRTSFPTASLSWARRRRFFFEGFDEWHIPEFITQVLPFLLHVALFLFLVGLVAFVWTLNRGIACGMIALTALLFGLYIVSTVLPIWRSNCPTATPLVRQLGDMCVFLALTVVTICHNIKTIFGDKRRAELPASRDSHHAYDGTLGRILRRLRDRWEGLHTASWDMSGHTVDEEPAVKHLTLQWLILVSGSESATSIALQSLGSLDPTSDFIPTLRTMTFGMGALSSLGSLQIAPSAVEVIRAIRSELVLGRGSWSLPMLGLDVTSAMVDILRSAYWPDAQLLSAAMIAGVGSTAPANTAAEPDTVQLLDCILSMRSLVWESTSDSHSLPSTARLLLYCENPPLRVLPYLLLSLSSGSLRNEDLRRILSIRDVAVKRSLALGSSLCGSEVHGPECDHQCIATFICKIVSMGDDLDCRIGTRLLSYFLRKVAATDEWIVLHDILVPPPDVLDGHGRIFHRRSLLLTQLLLGDRPGPTINFLQSTDRAAILHSLLQREVASFSEQFVLAPQIWVKLLLYFVAIPRTSYDLSEFTQVLAVACFLQRRRQLNNALIVLINSQVDRLLKSMTVASFANSNDSDHFMQHFVELDRAWCDRLGLLQPEDGEWSAPHWLPSLETEMRRYGHCRICAGSPADMEILHLDTADPAHSAELDPIPTQDELHDRALMSVSIVNLLLDEEWRTVDQAFALAPELWISLLVEVTKALRDEDLALPTLTPLLSGICMLRRRNVSHWETLRPLTARLEEWIALVPSVEPQSEDELAHFLNHALELDPVWVHDRLAPYTAAMESVLKGQTCGKCPGLPPAMSTIVHRMAQRHIVIPDIRVSEY